jgi:hypothetical protein
MSPRQKKRYPGFIVGKTFRPNPQLHRNPACINGAFRAETRTAARLYWARKMRIVPFSSPSHDFQVQVEEKAPNPEQNGKMSIL